MRGSSSSQRISNSHLLIAPSSSSPLDSIETPAETSFFWKEEAPPADAHYGRRPTKRQRLVPYTTEEQVGTDVELASFQDLQNAEAPPYSVKAEGSTWDQASPMTRLSELPCTTLPSRPLQSYDESALQTHVLPPTSSTPHQGRDDEFGLAASDEEDLAKLFDSVDAKTRNNPPSSVVRSMDSASSIERFDPKLQRSSPNTPEVNSAPNVDDEDLILDYEVDWDKILEALPSRPHDPSIQSPMAQTPPRTAEVASIVQTASQPKPFVRPPFPSPVRDKSPITGFTSSTVLRVCFRVGQLLNECRRAYNARQDVIFELYAKVIYSSRERTSRLQHFQFADLFKENPPYPTGILKGWKSGSVTDQQSSTFTGSGVGAGAKLCLCICKPIKEKKGHLGWSLEVLSIRPVGWEEIEQVRAVVCRM